MYWMVAAPAAVLLGVILAAPCAALAGARITHRTLRAGEHGMSGRYEEAQELKIGEGGP